MRIKLKTPDALFLNTLANSSSWIMSAADVGKAYKAPTDWNGTGPFMLGSWEPERQMTLKKNPNYWKPGLPYLDQIVMTVINDDNARMDALRSRSVDMTEYVPAVSFATLEGEQFQVFKRYDLNSFIRVNGSKAPLDNKKVRQALAMVVDRQAVNDLAFNGLGRTMIGGAPLQPPTSPYYVKELEGTYNKNWDKAKALLKEAGLQ